MALIGVAFAWSIWGKELTDDTLAVYFVAIKWYISNRVAMYGVL